MTQFPETSYSLIARVKDLADEASWIEFLGITTTAHVPLRADTEH